MDIKALFGGTALTFDQFSERLKTAGKDGAEAKLVDLSDGGYVGKDKFSTLESDRDNLKRQLATVQESLKKLEGADVDGLSQQVADLQKKIDDQEAAHQDQIAERDFSVALDGAIRGANGKSTKAVAAMLDLDSIRKSNNQQSDLAAALKALAESDPYLFGDNAPETPARVLNSGGSHEDGSGGGGGGNGTNQAMNALIRGDTKGD